MASASVPALTSLVTDWHVKVGAGVKPSPPKLLFDQEQRPPLRHLLSLPFSPFFAQGEKFCSDTQVQWDVCHRPPKQLEHRLWARTYKPVGQINPVPFLS